MQKLLLLLAGLCLLWACQKGATNKPVAKLPGGNPQKVVLPESQIFKINSQRDTMLLAKHGMRLFFTKGSLKDEDGKTATGAVEIELVEIASKADMLLARLNTMSDNKILESAGMFYLGATVGGKILQIDEKKPVYIEFPAHQALEEVQVFEGRYLPDGHLNWVNPRDTEKFLIKVPLELLDFDAPFRNPAELIELMDKATARYMAGREIFQASNKGDKKSPKEREPCFIRPDIVAALKDTKLANSWIATREFEERMRAIHYTCEEELIRIYLNNVDKNLWQADWQAFKYLKDKGNSHAARFEVFYQQKLTQVKEVSPSLSAAVKQITREVAQQREQAKKEKEAFAKAQTNAATYRFYLYSMGWCNLDRFFNDPRMKKSSLQVTIPDYLKYNLISVSLIFREHKATIPSNLQENELFIFTSADDRSIELPVGEEAMVLVQAFRGDNCFLGMTDFVVSEQNELKITLKEVSKKQLDRILKDIGSEDEPLWARKEEDTGEVDFSAFASTPITTWNDSTYTDLTQYYSCCLNELGAKIYRSNCVQCHAINSKVVGPALSESLSTQSLSWMLNFIKNPEAMIKRGDARSVVLYYEYRQFMPNHEFLSQEELLALMFYMQQLNKDKTEGIRTAN